jgi:pilus assembly protein Flp/PilA
LLSIDSNRSWRVAERLKWSAIELPGRAFCSVRAARKVALMRLELTAFLKDESGATSIEYCVVASGIVLAIVGAVARLGTSVHGMFVAVTTAIK